MAFSLAFESSPGGWEDVSSSAEESEVLSYGHFEEEAPLEQNYDQAPSVRASASTGLNASSHIYANTPRNALAGVRFSDTLPSRGPIDDAVVAFISQQDLNVPVSKLGRTDGTFQFGLRKMSALIGGRTGGLFVRVGNSAIPLAEFVIKYERVELRKIEGAAAGAQAAMRFLSSVK
jgi:hypothetical protein